MFFRKNPYAPLKDEAHFNILKMIAELWAENENTVYTVPIQSRFEANGRKYSLGQIYICADWLVEQGYITKTERTMDIDFHKRGGRGKIFYNMTEKGQDILAEVVEKVKDLPSTPDALSRG